jgi:hypothetical protein
MEISSCLLESTTEPRCDLPNAKSWTVGSNTYEKQNVYHFWSALWFIIVTTSTVGYGDQVRNKLYMLLCLWMFASAQRALTSQMRAFSSTFDLMPLTRASSSTFSSRADPGNSHWKAHGLFRCHHGNGFRLFAGSLALQRHLMDS